jgi:hypothetical protein
MRGQISISISVQAMEGAKYRISLITEIRKGLPNTKKSDFAIYDLSQRNMDFQKIPCSIDSSTIY